MTPPMPTFSHSTPRVCTMSTYISLIISFRMTPMFSPSMCCIPKAWNPTLAPSISTTFSAPYPPLSLRLAPHLATLLAQAPEAPTIAALMILQSVTSLTMRQQGTLARAIFLLSILVPIVMPKFLIILLLLMAPRAWTLLVTFFLPNLPQPTQATPTYTTYSSYQLTLL